MTPENQRRNDHVSADLAAALRLSERGQHAEALVKVENARVVLLSLVLDAERRQIREEMVASDLASLRRGGL